MNEVLVSWSGGKDCCLACYKAIASGLNVSYLASMMTEHTGRLWPHNLTPEALNMQAQAMDIPMVQRWTTVPAYKDEYVDMLKQLKNKGVTGAVFGDIKDGNRLAENHHLWVESVCNEAGMKLHLPIWQDKRADTIEDLIGAGFEAIIVCCAYGLGKDWLGRTMDKDMLEELKYRHSHSPNGDVGYYHTFVVDGPLFKRRLKLLETEVVRVGPYWYLDILRCGLSPKFSKKSNISEPLKI